jgi:serine/threonine protein kinase
VPPIIHRDLKPENIFIEPPLSVKVLDFGIVKALHQDFNTTQTDRVHGTAPYMSPEQAQGKAVTFASDVFQLGTIMYEMISGICPCLVGVEDPRPEVLIAIQISKPPPRLRKLVKGVPDHVDNLIWRAITKKPQERYREMRHFQAAIYESFQRCEKELPESELRMRSLTPKPREPHPALVAARARKRQPPRATIQTSKSAPAPEKATASEARSILRTTPFALASSISAEASEQSSADNGGERALAEIATTERAPAMRSLSPPAPDAHTAKSTLLGLAPPPKTAWEDAHSDLADDVHGHADDSREATPDSAEPESQASARRTYAQERPAEADIESARYDSRGSFAASVDTRSKSPQLPTWEYARKRLHSSLARAALIGLGIALPAGTYLGVSHRWQEEPSTPVAPMAASPRTAAPPQPAPPQEQAQARQEVVLADPAATPAAETEVAATSEAAEAPQPEPTPAARLESTSSPVPKTPSPAGVYAPRRKSTSGEAAPSPESERVRRRAKLLAEELKPNTAKTPAPAPATSAELNPSSKRKLWISND